MIAYRVFPHSRGAKPSQPGHPLYVAPQGAGRFDNPDLYRLRYLAADPTTAVIESFAGLAWWSERMFIYPGIPEASYKLAALDLPDDIEVADLDDPRVLVSLRARPTAVMSRDRNATQALARRIFERRATDGIRWWSTWPEHRPLMALWRDEAKVDHVEDLGLDHDAVIAAAGVLAKPVRVLR